MIALHVQESWGAYHPLEITIGYACDPGQEASEHSGKRLGCYTAGLLEHLGAPVKVSEMLFRANYATFKLSESLEVGQPQRAWFSCQTFEPFSLCWDGMLLARFVSAPAYASLCLPCSS